MSIVVDSAASLPSHALNDPRLHVAPMSLTIDRQGFTDGVDITPVEFYARLRQSPGAAATSAPSPGAFSEAFEKAAMTSRSILCIVVASRFSASEDSARTAKERFLRSRPDCEVSIMDSESAAGGEGLIALGALKRAAEGANLGDTRLAAEWVRKRVRLLAFVDTLYYLWKGGRVPMIVHAGASMLKLKPIFELRNAAIENLGRPRTARRAIDKLVDLMAERLDGGRLHLSVNHAAAGDHAALLHERIIDEFDCVESYVAEFTPAMGAHIGPGMVGVAFWSE